MKKKYLTLQEHQKILYELLYTLDDFCKEHQIRYFLAFGTLIGAIRHHGIIPWDDDVDVMMERDEYERFEKLITKHPPRGYKAYSINNTRHYYYPFIKFGKLGTKLIEEGWKCVPKEGIGINIDVFPIDGCPNDKNVAEEYVVTEMNKIFYNLGLWCNNGGKDFVGIRQKMYYWIRTRSLLLRCFFKKLYRDAAKYSLCDSTYYFTFWSFCGAKCLHSKKALENQIHVPFGSRNLPIPEGYDTILREQYGDYMTPPPEKEKESTHKHEIYIELE